MTNKANSRTKTNSSATTLKMSVPKYSNQQVERNRCTLKVDPIVHDMVSEISFKTRKSMVTVASEMLQFAYDHIELE